MNENKQSLPLSVPQTSKSQLTQSAANVTGRTFCSYHSGAVETHLGGWIVRNKIKKFMCHGCMKIRKMKPAPTMN